MNISELCVLISRGRKSGPRWNLQCQKCYYFIIPMTKANIIIRKKLKRASRPHFSNVKWRRKFTIIYWAGVLQTVKWNIKVFASLHSNMLCEDVYVTLCVQNHICPSAHAYIYICIYIYIYIYMYIYLYMYIYIWTYTYIYIYIYIYDQLAGCLAGCLNGCLAGWPARWLHD